MLKRILIPLLLSFFAANAQDFNPDARALPETSTREDFSFLKQELAGVQLLLLGEQSHYDGNVFEMKTKIIDYLYHELGYKTIAFESGIYDLWQAQSEIRKGTDTNTAFQNSLYSIWGKTQEFQNFIAFFDKNKLDLKLYGFDNQTSGKYGQEQLFIGLFDYCKKHGLNLKLDRGDLELLMESVYSSSVFDENDISYKQFTSELTHLLKSIAKKPENEAHFYWTQIIKSILSVGEDCYLKTNPIVSGFYVSRDDNIRDKQMADNLLAYIKRYPNEKIICWGANQHFANSLASVTNSTLKEFLPMGAHLKTTLKDKMYSLAMVTASDSIFINSKWHQTPIEKNSFESYLKGKKQQHLYISANQPKMKQAIPNRLFSPVEFITANLNEVHDGYLSLPLTRIATRLSEDETFTINRKIQESEAIFNPVTIDEKSIQLSEVLVKSRKMPYSLVKRAIERLDVNYPITDFSSEMHSRIHVKTNDSLVLDLEFTASQFDRGYNQMYRNSKQIREIRWNVKNGYAPKSIQSEFYRTYIHNPIMYGRFLNARKFKKFVFTEEDSNDSINGSEVHTIHFTTLRDQFSYTDRSFLSNFSGTIFINKNDFAVVRIIENWEVIGYKKDHDLSHELSGWPEKYVKRESVVESFETNFTKSGNVYYLSSATNKISGNLTQPDNSQTPFEISVKSTWNHFEKDKPEKIAFKDEQNDLDKAIYRPDFWKDYIPLNDSE